MNRSPSLPSPLSCTRSEAELAALAVRIGQWARELGFATSGISDVALNDAEARLAAWLDAGYHGDMDYMAKHGIKRTRPAMLVEGTQRVISVRMAYLSASSCTANAGQNAVHDDWRQRERARLADPQAASVSIYARGRDYHKVMRQRLQQLAQRIEQEIGGYGHRVFTDSAPVMEVELAQKAGLGWRGKHTLLVSREAGSLFFLGEIYVDLPLPVNEKPSGTNAHCGNCTRCLAACPTGAIVAPWRVDARRCISYLTIEHQGSIPLPLRALIGNRIYGCDDCQLACPWNKFAQAAPVDDFDVRHGLERASLVELAAWNERQFNQRMEGSAIRRIGYARWSRNLAVALGNALRAPLRGQENACAVDTDTGSKLDGIYAINNAIDGKARTAIIAALRARENDASALVREHVLWALQGA